MVTQPPRRRYGYHGSMWRSRAVLCALAPVACGGDDGSAPAPDASPGDAVSADAPEADGALLPDLVVVGQRTIDSISIDTRTFGAASCEVDESCVNASG